MNNTKFVDLHKVASLLRDIQTAGQQEVESEVAHEEAVQEDNAFNTAAAKAAVAGQSEFEFNGKKYPVKMSKEEAQKLLDSQVNDEEPVVEEPEADAEEVLKRGMEDEMADKIKDKLEDEDEEAKESAPMGEYTDKEFACININTGEYGYCDKDELHKYTHKVPANEFTYFDDTSGMDFADFDDEMADQEGWTKIPTGNIGEENVNELNVPNDKAKVIAQIQKLDKMADEARANDDPNKAMAIERGSEMTALYNKLEKLGGDPFNIPDANDESVSEDSETGTLQQLLKLAGLKVVTDADINQVDEYSNSPDEEYADTDTQLNKLSGGINGPKAIPAVGNDGHNRLVMKLKKAYSDME